MYPILTELYAHTICASSTKRWLKNDDNGSAVVWDEHGTSSVSITAIFPEPYEWKRCTNQKIKKCSEFSQILISRWAQKLITAFQLLRQEIGCGTKLELSTLNRKMIPDILVESSMFAYFTSYWYEYIFMQTVQDGQALKCQFKFIFSLFLLVCSF